ncbi:hypothetical protein L1987_27595 [Smallanthus sonchifolius]|uniref:Uncharacterized protein n=1 Tax=Smallanthus sonchifolius TaxID=185202 RepID=A0ACB9IC28_9ASTR|nr:hypothetical protein L1987_27595 [Smallanthus sonchifolius]
MVEVGESYRTRARCRNILLGRERIRDQRRQLVLIERNITEDGSRNPSVIVDNVGDIVGDIAGMGYWDLFCLVICWVVTCMVCEDALLGAPFYFPIEAEPKPVLEISLSTS